MRTKNFLLTSLIWGLISIAAQPAALADDYALKRPEFANDTIQSSPFGLSVPQSAPKEIENPDAWRKGYALALAGRQYGVLIHRDSKVPAYLSATRQACGGMKGDELHWCVEGYKAGKTEMTNYFVHNSKNADPCTQGFLQGANLYMHLKKCTESTSDDPKEDMPYLGCMAMGFKMAEQMDNERVAANKVSLPPGDPLLVQVSNDPSKSPDGTGVRQGIDPAVKLVEVAQGT